MMETEIFPTKSYSEIKQGLPASALKATGGAYDGGSENYIVETKIYENHRRDARYGEDEEFHKGDRVMFECRDGQVIRGRIYAENDDGTYNVRDEDTMELHPRIFENEMSRMDDNEEPAVTFTKFNDEAINPSYYKDGKYECFDVAMARIREMGLPGMEGAMFFNVFKYLWRYKVKHADNPREDLEKAAWYLRQLIVCVTDKAKV